MMYSCQRHGADSQLIRNSPIFDRNKTTPTVSLLLTDSQDKLYLELCSFYHISRGCYGSPDGANGFRASLQLSQVQWKCVS